MDRKMMIIIAVVVAIVLVGGFIAASGQKDSKNVSLSVGGKTFSATVE